MTTTNKILIWAIGVIATISLLSSCDDFLDIKPYGKTIPETTEEYQALLNSLLGPIDGNFSSDVNAEDIFFGNDDVEDYEEICDNLETNITEMPLGNSLKYYVGQIISQSYIPSKYVNLYEVIRQCNIILDNYEEGRETQEGQDIIGTCYAIRGVAYYQLLRLYCAPVGQENQELGVPIVTDFDMEARPNRSTIDETIAQSENDLKAALNCNIQNEAYLFNNDVINGCLCRLYFWANRWSEAKELADALLTKHPLLSGNDYKVMMSAQTGLTGNMLIRCDRMSSSSFDLANQYISARPFSTRFLKLFPEGDKDVRYDICFRKGRKNKKYFISSIRSAELALISMECAYHLGNNEEALRELNDFRDHRITNNAHYTMSTLPAVDNSELIKTDCEGNALTPLIQAILNERRKELYMENGDRFFELKRNGRPEFWIVSHGLKYTTYKYMYTFPIPPKDVKLNPSIVQNPGYSEVVYN